MFLANPLYVCTRLALLVNVCVFRTTYPSHPLTDKRSLPHLHTVPLHTLRADRYRLPEAPTPSRTNNPSHTYTQCL